MFDFSRLSCFRRFSPVRRFLIAENCQGKVFFACRYSVYQVNFLHKLFPMLVGCERNPAASDPRIFSLLLHQSVPSLIIGCSLYRREPPFNFHCPAAAFFFELFFAYLSVNCTCEKIVASFELINLSVSKHFTNSLLACFEVSQNVNGNYLFEISINVS